MTVAQLIAALQEMPQDADVYTMTNETETHYAVERWIYSVRFDGDSVELR